MSTAALPAPEPARIPEVEPFWAAAAEGRLVLPRCRGCAQLIWYPRTWCARCMSSDVEWVATTGRGTVYSCTTVRRGGAPAYAEALPYVLAYVELEEGLRILTNIRTTDPDSVEIGLPVRVVFDPAGDTALPRFELVAAGSGASNG